MQNPWKLNTGKQIYNNAWIILKEDEVINPGGGISHYSHVHFKNFAIGIIPMDKKLNTWLVGQWRYTLNEYSWEIPMGGGDLRIDPLLSGQRELKEETGISAGKWTKILKIHTSNSLTNELGFVYLAEDLQFGDTEFEETEKLEIKKVQITEAIKMCEMGKITDSLSVAGLFQLGRILKI